jgi:hypothetical protein
LAPGGTSAIVVDNEGRREIKDYVTSSGTLRNCAGGGTPWGIWLTCEKTRNERHGFVFEVDPNNPENRLSKTPIRDMGSSRMRVVDIDPTTGIAYLTEDDFRGIIPTDATQEVVADDTPPGTRVRFLYRYTPQDRRQRPGALQKGGRLQVLTLEQGNFNADLANYRGRGLKSLADKLGLNQEMLRLALAFSFEDDPES